MRWKLVVGIAALLMVTLVVTVYLILADYDYNKLKPQVAQAVRDATGRELTLGGDIKLAIGLSPSLVVADVGFANAPWASQPQMIKAEELRVQVELLPLFLGDVEFDRIVLSDVQMLLETEASGRGNWEFPAGDKSKKSTWPVRELAIENVKILNLKLSFHDGESGATNRFVVDNLDASREPSSGALTIDLKGTANGQTLALSGKTGTIRSLLAHQPMELDLSGRISDASVEIGGTIGDVLELEGIDVKVNVYGTDLADLGVPAGIKLPRTDAFQIAAHLRGAADSLALEDINGNVSRGSVTVTGNGKVSDLIALTGVDLEVTGSGKDLAEVGAVVGEKLPETGPFTVKGRLTGSGKTLTFQEAQAHVSSGSLRAALNGRIGDLVALKGIHLRFNGSGKDLAEVGAVIGEKLPETGPFTVTGRLTGSSKTLSLQDAEGNVRRDRLNLTVNGKIRNLLALKGIDLKIRGSGADLNELGPLTGATVPKTGPFKVTGRLTGSGTTLSFQDVRGHVSRDSMRLAVNGKITDLLALKGIALEVIGSGKELAEIGPMIDTKLPEFGSFDVSGNLRGSSEALALDGLSVIIDNSDFNGSARLEFRQRPKLAVALESGLVDFSPLLGEAKKEDKILNKKGGVDKRLFPDDPLPFEVLEKVDADIVLKAESIKAREAQFDLGYLILTLKDNRLRIDRLEAMYRGTKLSGNVEFYPGSPPRLASKFLVQGFDLGRYLREIGASNKAVGHIDIAADLKSQGNSAHTLAANLDGTISLVMGRGHLSKWLNLIAINLSKKVTTFWGEHKEGDNIICAVVDFDINSGIATSRAFVFDTEIAVLTAEGDINLGTEQINFLLAPKPKGISLTMLDTKLRVRGSIQHPKVRPDPASLAFKGAKALSALAVGPVGLLVPFVSLGAHEKHPCDIKQLGNKVH